MKERYSMKQFLENLSSKEPVPGGGGASALIGAISCALCSMVANLTTGKKKYAQYQNRIDELLPILEQLRTDLLLDIQKDADAFYPLSQAYSLDKNTPDYDKIMEEALLTASNAPMKIVEDVSRLIPILEELEQIGSRLAVSDVAVAAAACSAALKGAVMNIYINTKSMKNRETAETMNKRAKELSKDGVKRCDKVYEKICAGMM
ncbi:MAG: cyclodeaminase/cyclohydrolase family protein [Lachnospiraceae bacterium]|nr:cyclodeaminase/cyclohydrolase family protein [Lachnospiraceae bacterium]